MNERTVTKTKTKPTNVQFARIHMQNRFDQKWSCQQQQKKQRREENATVVYNNVTISIVECAERNVKQIT